MKYSIKLDLCPKACGECNTILSGDPIVGKGGSTSAGAGCADKNVKISGKGCYQIAREGFCNSNTNIGNVGRDLCPKSCGNYPPVPQFNAGVDPNSYRDPTPARVVGGGSSAVVPPPSPPPPP